MAHRAPNGFGHKAIFFGVLLPHFRRSENRERLLETVLGSASEQWINCECFQAIRRARPTCAIRPEWKKRDIAFFREYGDEEPVSIIETKVLYANYSRAKQVGMIARLEEQMREATDWVGGAAHRNAIGGLVVSFDWAWADRESGESGAPASHGWYPNVDKITNCGLQNAFGHHPGGRVVSGRVEQAGRVFDVAVRFEMVRLR